MLGVLGYAVPRIDFLFIFFAMGAIPYAATAAILAALICSARSTRTYVRLLLLAPALFGVVFALFVAIADRVTGAPPETHQSIPQALSAVVVGAAYSVPVVLVAWLAWVIFKAVGWVKDELAT